MTGRLFWDSFKVLGNLRVRQPLSASLNMFNRVSFWSFCPLWLSHVAPKLLISLGPHNAVLFSDWGKHNRITPYNVGGFVCQEQEANYVDMLLLTRGCTFITHTPAVLKALDKSFYSSDSSKDKGEEILSLRGIERIWKKMRKRILLTPNSPPLSVSLPPSLALFLPLSVSPDSCHSLHTMDQDYYEGTDYLSPVPADGERTEEFEYEVGITLDITAY